MIPTDYGIPTTQNCVFAVSLAMGKKTEEILIGERDSIERHLSGFPNETILCQIRRDIGRLLMDYVPMASDLADIRAALLDSTSKNKSPYFDSAVSALTVYYQSDNPIFRFTALLIWQEYHRAIKDKTAEENLFNTLDDITLPLRFNVMDGVRNWQGMNRKNPLAYLDRDFRKYPVSLYYSGDKSTSEYAVTDISVLSIAVYYLKRIYDSGRFVQACPICGRSFVAKTAGMTTLCSDDCRRIQGKENKRRFDERAKKTDYERSSKNAYMYWYNKITKLRKTPGIPISMLEQVESKFKAYSEEANRRKKAVAGKKAASADYESWLLSQRDIIDGIMERVLAQKK